LSRKRFSDLYIPRFDQSCAHIFIPQANSTSESDEIPEKRPTPAHFCQCREPEKLKVIRLLLDQDTLKTSPEINNKWGLYK
jgi:hypothetical protein